MGIARRKFSKELKVEAVTCFHGKIVACQSTVEWGCCQKVALWGYMKLKTTKNRLAGG